MSRPAFNQSLTMPVVDLVVAAILIFTTGYFWMDTKGEAKLADSKAQLETARVENATEVTRIEGKLADQEVNLENTQKDEQDKAAYVEFLKVKKDTEDQLIAEAAELNEIYTDDMLDLRTDIQRSKDRRIGYNTDIFETDKKIETMEAANADMLARVNDRNGEESRLNVWIADAEQREVFEPTSRLPDKSSVASVIDISDPSQSVVLSLAYQLQKVSGMDMGLIGSLGLGVDGESAIKEGGIFANLPLTHRRTSIDFEGGISQFESRKENISDTSPFAGATFRFAPNPKERLFLLAGTRYAHEDLALRLGLAFGRK
jgi:hypothetical protein